MFRDDGGSIVVAVLNTLHISHAIWSHDIRSSGAVTVHAQVFFLSNPLVVSDVGTMSETFVREVISKSSNAFDMIRCESITDPSEDWGPAELLHENHPRKTNSAITIEDSGVGTTKNELVNDLGTIYQGVMEAMSAGGDISMIGQLGVSIRPVWFRTKSVWLTRTTTMNSTSGSRRLVVLSLCRKTPKWGTERSSEERRSFVSCWRTSPNSWRNVA